MIKQAIIPLAGLGTRLLPLTSVIPKELLPINGKHGLDYILEEIKEEFKDTDWSQTIDRFHIKNSDIEKDLNEFINSI